MSGFAVKGWCPDAWQPMMSGDGLLVRVRPRLGRLTASQALGLCEAALAHGNGLIDATSRANLQIRGVSEQSWSDLIAELIALDLVDRDPLMEARRNILVAPDWRSGDDTARITTMLMERLNELPELPAKVGFAIDVGMTPVLGEEAGDFRIERVIDDGLILRAAGHARGVPVARGGEIDALIALAHWFVESGGGEAGRMARHDIPLPGWAIGDVLPSSAGPRITPGAHSLGAAYGLAFGRIDARALARLTVTSGAHAVRITPWRIIILEGADSGPAQGFLHNPADPALRVDACPGKPVCPQASVETRTLAIRLAPHVEGRLHVSGCAKGCACAQPATVTLTGRNGRFDLATDARAGDPPTRKSLSPAALLARFRAV